MKKIKIGNVYQVKEGNCVIIGYKNKVYTGLYFSPNGWTVFTICKDTINAFKKSIPLFDIDKLKDNGTIVDIADTCNLNISEKALKN